jgi:hypothetical protein
MSTEALSDGWPRLRESEALGRLLTHYADLGAADREARQDRRMDLEGVEPRLGGPVVQGVPDVSRWTRWRRPLDYPPADLVGWSRRRLDCSLNCRWFNGAGHAGYRAECWPIRRSERLLPPERVYHPHRHRPPRRSGGTSGLRGRPARVVTWDSWTAFVIPPRRRAFGGRIVPRKPEPLQDLRSRSVLTRTTWFTRPVASTSRSVRAYSGSSGLRASALGQ